MNDSKATNVQFLFDFLASATVENIASYTPEQARQLSDILHCHAYEDDSFAQTFPDTDITACRNPNGKPLPGGRSRDYLEKHNEWEPEDILRRQCQYIRFRLLPSSRRKMHEVLNGDNFVKYSRALATEVKDIFDELKTWLNQDEN